ncbi:response regulator transcription factor [Arcanobacterium hippocoleae]|uniref:DNA-binding NarL/FixJ family response regulator n=1 Tax=Arcanobacterium hippocoleae TaxID=149017 RepID=A0ABU1T0Z9_9ACTO|nr:response regulator transcription factor [Arcanobacterium hippocoleae]MDR6938536.1 DNA-binding NarL/FixJ family response regulator [Arcanobacterium hippocoleae]
MSEDIRVLLADDDQIIRDGLANLLNLQDGITVVTAVENGRAALHVLAEHRVDVALLDVDMPVLDGIRTAKEIGRMYPNIAVVMLTAFEHEDSLAQSLASNVRGFLTKDILAPELAQLIKQAHSGQRVFGPRPTQILAESYMVYSKNDPTYDDFRQKVEQLPNYLRSVFDLLIQALPNKIIARELGITEATARSYISELFTATGFTNRGELTVTAVKAGY